jgi:hypothetical protein
LSADKTQWRQLIVLLEAADESSWQWLVKQLRASQQPTTAAELLSMVKNHPGISAKKLVTYTDCTLGEARTALDDAEWQ